MMSKARALTVLLLLPMVLPGCGGTSDSDDDSQDARPSAGAGGQVATGGAEATAGALSFGGHAGSNGIAGSGGASGGSAGTLGQGGALAGGDDADGDRISDAEEGKDEDRDSDGDGTPDYLDEDADDDGISDAIEADVGTRARPPLDSDHDDVPDYLDLDSDDDGTSDADEVAAGWDSDGDLKPDYRDTDSDNDDIADADEEALGLDPRNEDTDGDFIADGADGIEDSDGDGVIDALDDDSDDDGHSDGVEVGHRSTETPPLDSDHDGTPDFLDLDSDQDGLPDALEKDCGRLTLDADGDGYSDLAEQQLGSDGCDADSTVLDTGVDFFFVLPYEGPTQSSTLRFVPTVKRADIVFNVDTTGSMGSVITNLTTNLASIATATRARVSDSAFGVCSFRDYPFDSYGSPGDLPFYLNAPVTDNLPTVQAATNALSVAGGADFPEAGFEALYQVAAGDGVTGVSATGTAFRYDPFTKSGTIGGAQFRPGSLPIVVHATDAPAHDDYPASYNSHGSTAALNALTRAGVRVITIQLSSDLSATDQLRNISETTRAILPVCAFKTGETTWRCGVDTCCSGTIATGTGADQRCTLRYSLVDTTLATASVDGIDALIKYTTFDVFADKRDDGKPSTPDTSAFIERVEANDPDDDFKPPLEPEFSCNPVPVPSRFEGAKYDNGFRGFAVGSSSRTREGAKLFFTVEAKNTTVQETNEPQLFRAFIDIVDETTGAVLDTQEVVVIVPARAGGAGE